MVVMVTACDAYYGDERCIVELFAVAIDGDTCECIMAVVVVVVVRGKTSRRRRRKK